MITEQETDSWKTEVVVKIGKMQSTMRKRRAGENYCYFVLVVATVMRRWLD